MKSKIMRYAHCLALLMLSVALKAQTISPVSQPTSASLRGLSVVDDKIAWVSGSKGSFAITDDGGKNWAWRQVKGFEKSDFRAIEAFSAREAIIMSSGTPAVILKTTDGGATWQEKYRQPDSAYFLDAMDFADSKHGFVMGDPIKDEFLLLETKDRGETWAKIKGPAAAKDEAAFAASGTCLRVYKNQIIIVTGGSQSRILSTATAFPVDWTSAFLPLTNGNAARGAFSSARGKKQTIVVGGNYSKEAVADSVAYLLPYGKSTIKSGNPSVGPAGYQSCVEYIAGEIYLSTGTPGSNLTIDGGKTWRKIDGTSYNVCRKARHGNLILFAGDKGKIGIYKP